MMSFDETEKYIRDLTQQQLAYYNDWRLPTLEEAMSLMEPKIYGALCIDQVFDRKQIVIWTANRYGLVTAWAVHFHLSTCRNQLVNLKNAHVRAVRYGQSII